jgi:hypothetical protein
MNQQTVHIALDVNEVNTVLAAIGKLPYDQVANLIPKIVAQAQSQLTPPPIEQHEGDAIEH